LLSNSDIRFYQALFRKACHSSAVGYIRDGDLYDTNFQLHFAVIFISYQALVIISSQVAFTAELFNDVVEPGNHYGTPAPDVFMLADPLSRLILTLRAL